MSDPRSQHNSSASSGDAWWLISACLLVIISLTLRLLFLPVVTSDYSGFLAHWFTTLHMQGLSSFAYPFADYAPLYLYFLKLLSYIPVPSLYSVKALSITFDVVIAFFTYRVVRDTLPARRAIAFFCAAVMFAIPTLLLNSSFWGQSDSIYAAGVLAALYFLLRRKPFFAVIAFSLALCIKVQAIFFAPVLIGYLLHERWKISYLLIVPAIFFLSLIPALAGGGHLSYWGLIYIKQAGEYPYLSVSSPSVFAFFNTFSSTKWESLFFYTGLIIASVIGILVAGSIAFNRRFSSFALIRISFFCVLAIPYFLPRMHERYFYLADIFSVLYVFFAPRQWYLGVLVVLSSFLSYLPYLSQTALFSSFGNIDLRIPAALLGVALLTLLYKASKNSDALIRPS